jgi:hypothetical protein
MGLELRGTSCSIWRTAFLVSALTVSAGTAVPDRAYAEGFLDFLFGGFQRPSPPPAAPPLHLRSVEWLRQLWVTRV